MFDATGPFVSVDPDGRQSQSSQNTDQQAVAAFKTFWASLTPGEKQAAVAEESDPEVFKKLKTKLGIAVSGVNSSVRKRVAYKVAVIFLAQRWLALGGRRKSPPKYRRYDCTLLAAAIHGQAMWLAGMGSDTSVAGSKGSKSISLVGRAPRRGADEKRMYNRNKAGRLSPNQRLYTAPTKYGAYGSYSARRARAVRYLSRKPGGIGSLLIAYERRGAKRARHLGTVVARGRRWIATIESSTGNDRIRFHIYKVQGSRFKKLSPRESRSVPGFGIKSSTPRFDVFGNPTGIWKIRAAKWRSAPKP